MILWHTDIDTFEHGQWIKGTVKRATMSRDGKYIALRIYPEKPRKRNIWTHPAHICVSKPPYFSAIEVSESAQPGRVLEFDWYGNLNVNAKKIKSYATNYCPLNRIVYNWIESFFATFGYSKGIAADHFVIDSSDGPARGRDQQGRTILIEKGCIYAIDNDSQKLLLDTNDMQFEAIAPPPGTQDW
ncbi:MAG: hypothetical protein KDC26_09780 [Armatimonadetes bacterium]|nr:hypothetical protein [Armatimonadota bacterium]